MTLQISKSEGTLLDAERGVCTSGWWTVKGDGVHAMFTFDDPRDRGTTFGISEARALESARYFMASGLMHEALTVVNQWMKSIGWTEGHGGIGGVAFAKVSEAIAAAEGQQ